VTLGVTRARKVLVANQAREKYKSAADLKGARIIAGGAGSSKTTVANALVLAGGHQIGDYTRIANESKDRIVATLKSGGADLVVAPHARRRLLRSARRGPRFLPTSLPSRARARTWAGSCYRDRST
jgi:ABC-type amino acid transport substrate-binding protein